MLPGSLLASAYLVCVFAFAGVNLTVTYSCGFQVVETSDHCCRHFGYERPSGKIHISLKTSQPPLWTEMKRPSLPLLKPNPTLLDVIYVTHSHIIDHLECRFSDFQLQNVFSCSCLCALFWITRSNVKDILVLVLVLESGHVCHTWSPSLLFNVYYVSA